MSDDVRIESIALAKLFYEDHRQMFSDAMLQEDVEQQSFYIPGADFDGWLVKVGALEAAADDYESNTVERYGVVAHRNSHRRRMNAFALKAEDYPAYTIGAADKQGRLRVRLVDLYTRDEPAEIARRFRVSTTHYKRQVGKIEKLANQSQLVSSAVRNSVTFYAGFMVPLLEAFAKAGANLERDIRNQNNPHSVVIEIATKRRRKQIRRQRTS
jgi:hypothetical protein